MTAVDWNRYQKCPQCGAALGKPCRELTGYVPGAQGGVIETVAAEPHPGRELRTGYAGTGGDR